MKVFLRFGYIIVTINIYFISSKDVYLRLKALLYQKKKKKKMQ
jgi:hypothetical protein